MTAAAASSAANLIAPSAEAAPPPDALWRRIWQSGRVRVGGIILLIVVLLCLGTLPMTLREPPKVVENGIAKQLTEERPFFYDNQRDKEARKPPGREMWKWFGTDILGRSLLGRCLLGGCISLGIGIMAAAISVALGLTFGLLAGYRGGWVDSVLMRTVDILYGLPYILLVILLKVALEPKLQNFMRPALANLTVLFLAIGLVSWLTMARVVRGQVLSLRSQPFIEAARAAGLTETRIFFHHLLPNLIGPVVVYASLIVPQAMLQESFLSFLGVGVAAPMPSWGSLAAEGLDPALNTVESRWWMLTFPCILLAVTLLCLNFLGDGLRDVFDPRKEAAKI
jgi:oligopeptide transport system permease protein